MASKVTPRMKKKAVQSLSQLFRSTRNEDEMVYLLEDLLTSSEQVDLYERWTLVSQLLEGRTQRDVRDKTGVSISKVSRGAHTLKNGNGAFEKAWKKLSRGTSAKRR